MIGPSFRVTARDARIIQKIVERADAERWPDPYTKRPNDYRLALSMDITACHANGNPLRLEELLGAAPFDFMHDVLGIQRHIDRETGKLRDCFVPRYSIPDAAR